MQTSTYPARNIPLSCFIGSPLSTTTDSHLPTHMLALLSYVTAYKRHTYPYCTSLGYVLPSHPQCLSSLPVHSDRWADPRSLCRWDRTGEKTLSPFSVWLLKTAPMANKNSAQGTQMAAHTAAAIAVWNVSHEIRQERRIQWTRQPWSWKTRFRLRRCAEDVMI